MQLRIDEFVDAGQTEVMYPGEQRWPLPHTMMLVSLVSGGLWFAIVAFIRFLVT